MGSKDFDISLESFTTSLQVGMVIELQWKARESAPRFLWWFALVHQVKGPDEVVVFFPQYGPRPDGDEGALTSVATLQRTHTTRMHGGVAGGVRVPDAASVVQWWMALGTDELDIQYHGIDRPDGQIRTDFLKHLPQEQPMLSLNLAGVEPEQAVRTDASVGFSRACYCC